MKLFKLYCKEHGIISDPDKCFYSIADMPEKNVQLSLFDGI
jgi:hypothetical protein